MAITKRKKAIRESVTAGKIYPLQQALELLKKISSDEKTKLKFEEMVEVAVNLGVDPKKSDQAVRGATVLPNGTGKKVRVAVFAQGANADAAREAGADIVGFEDLAETIQAGKMDFDLVIASPDAMRIVGKLGQILGPRGLMPNPKVGTVTPNIAQAVQNAKTGQIQYRTDKGAIIHCPIGKVSFTADALAENLSTLLAALKKAKPSSAKGVYIKRVTLSTTMGAGLAVDLSSVAV